MSILLNKNSTILVQGITGAQGTLHTKLCQAYYETKIVAGVTPGKGGIDVEGVPVYNFVKDAVKDHKIDCSLIFVPAVFCAEAILEAIESEIKLIIVITEGIATSDMSKVLAVARNSRSRIIGPNCPGIITPGEVKAGIMPGDIHVKGKIGVVSRSGTLTYETVDQITKLGFGQSTCVGIGGDPLIGSDFKDILHLFQNDPQTEAIAMIGEIGGSSEEEASDFIQSNVTKPVTAFIAGQTAPPGRRMGHAGAIISGSKGAAKDKMKYLEKNGVRVAVSPAEIGLAVKQSLE